MEAYLDNAATTRVSAKVYEKMSETFLAEYGNPSSKHTVGMNAEKYVTESRQAIARILKCEPSEIIFTSGGTESNNMALIGSALAKVRRGKHIITTRMEHASVYNPVLFLEEQGFQVSFCEVDKMGRVDIDNLLSLMREDTVLVSVMYVNNEVGSINPIKEISDRIKEKRPEVLFHVDAIQAFGKMKIVPKNLGIDLMSVSGHKIHGPKGSGFLYVKKGVNIKPIIYGGGQEKGMRSGTENVPAIAGIGVAATEMYNELDKNRANMYACKKAMYEGLINMPGVMVHAVSGPEDIINTAPHIISAGFEKVRAEVLLHALEERGVYVSSGSACSSNHPAISGTLKALGTPDKYLDSTIRFSFSKETGPEEVKYALDCINELVPILTKYTRK